MPEYNTVMNIRRGFAFIEIIIVTAIILFLAYKLLNSYFKQPLVDKETQKALSEQGISTTNYKAMTESVRDKLQNIMDNRTEQLKELQKELNPASQ